MVDAKMQKKYREAAAKLKPRPVELPSGKWRCQVMVAGRRESVVADTPKEAHARALALRAGLIESTKPRSALTLREAIDRYIESKDSVLSPATVAGYKRIRDNALPDLMGKNLHSMTQEDIQKSINKMAKTKSPKTVRNAHGLLSAVMDAYRPQFSLKTTLPQKQKYEVSIPDEDDIKALMAAAEGTPFELPLLLAMWLGLRASEIRGLTWDCVKDDRIHIKSAIVEGEDGPCVKGTKSFAGDRWLLLPGRIQELLAQQPKTDEYIIHLTGQAMYKRFSRLCEKAGVRHYRFHDLRHTAASVAMMLGVPNTYNQRRMGHKTDNMLKTTYLHTIRPKEEEYDTAISDYFTFLHTDLHTKK
jgi:integrase